MNVWLEIDSEARAQEAFLMVVDAFEAAEQRMSRFRIDSELSWLNAQNNQWAQLSPPMWHVVLKALMLAEETGGLFDPTLHDALIQAGYAQSFNTLDGHVSAPSAEIMLSGGRQAIEIDPDEHVIFLPEGVRIDLGGIGKGFTAQTVIGWLNEWGACLIDAGGDLTAGDAPCDMPGWPVGIGAPWTPEEPDQRNLVRLWLANSSLATSGVDYRRWQRGDVMAHHIIDPRTGISAETDLLTCSVISADACRAEAWATATLVAGMQAGYQSLAAQPLAGVLIDHARTPLLTPLMRPIAQMETALSGA